LTGAPLVSVVIATRDRAQRLERALDAVAAQDLAGAFEVIVVDDASVDETPAILEARERAGGAGAPRGIRRASAGGPAAARNEGWRAAVAPLIAFTDDDCEPQEGWLSALVEGAAAAPDAIVQGLTSPNPAEVGRLGPFSRTLDVRELGPWFPAANVAYPRALLERLGGFDESLLRGEDTDLAWRGREAGAGAVLAPAAVVHHAVMDLGPVGKLRLVRQWGPAFRNFARHPELRDRLYLGRFWKASHARLLLALAGVALARRVPVALVLAIPYARELRARMAAEHASLPAAPYYPLHDLVEIGTALSGSVRAGVIVL
jgi:glycosyltransferase involved in cell wall biosynthesis